MDILSRYKDTLQKLKERHNSLFMVAYPKRDFRRIEMLEDEILDVEYAISLMEKRDNVCGYRPRRSTLMCRADLYIDVMRK